MPFYVYILKYADDAYYTGCTNDLSRRLSEHRAGSSKTAYTALRRPVELVWGEEVESLGEALQHERQIKGWNRARRKL